MSETILYETIKSGPFKGDRKCVKCGGAETGAQHYAAGWIEGNYEWYPRCFFEPEKIIRKEEK